jgi:hypothetical protein
MARATTWSRRIEARPSGAKGRVLFLEGQAGHLVWLACLLIVLTVRGALAAEEDRPPVRREERITFETDARFQEGGGVQYFYELIDRDQDALARESFAMLQPLDVRGRWAGRKEPFHVLVSRIVYTIDKDVSFFTAERVTDVAYMNTILPGADIRRKAPGEYTVTKTPANSFTVRYLGREALTATPRDAALERFLSLAPDPGLPDSVVVQENFDFARVMGVRTSELSITWTAHYPLGPGRTRVHVCTMSLLYNLPPFFLGGRQRVHDEALGGALMLIQALRAYPAD